MRHVFRACQNSLQFRPSYKLLGALLLAGGLAACSNDEKPAPSPDLVTYKLKLDVLPDTDKSIQDLAASINAGSAVSFNHVTELLVEKHAVSDATKAKLSQIVPTNLGALSQRQTKIGYESLLKKLSGDRDLIYNRNATNISQVLEDGKMQCYSGTYLYQLIRRRIGAQAFRKSNEVVILQPGHILPGYIDEKDKMSAIIGVETTVRGGGGRVLAIFDEKSKSIGNIRVVDAELFALVELMQNEVTNKDELLQQVLDQTAKRYGFEVTAVQVPVAPGAGVSSTSGQSSVQNSEQMLNSSLLGFGSISVPAGDQARSESGDSGDRDMLTGFGIPTSSRTEPGRPELEHGGDFSTEMLVDKQVLVHLPHGIFMVQNFRAHKLMNSLLGLATSRGQAFERRKECGKACAEFLDLLELQRQDPAKILDSQLADLRPLKCTIRGVEITRLYDCDFGVFEVSAEAFHVSYMTKPTRHIYDRTSELSFTVDQGQAIEKENDHRKIDFLLIQGAAF